MHILKFGGSSVGSPLRIKKVIKIILKAHKKDDLVVVVSAFQKVTDSLVEAAKLAQSENSDYKKVTKQLEMRHQKAVRSLVEKKHLAKTKKEVEDLFIDLNTALHGVFITRELTSKIMDFVSSFGERLSAIIISNSIPNGIYLDARNVIKTDDNYGYASVALRDTYKNIQEYLKNTPRKKVIITTGFIGSTTARNTTTLGRNGSDLTASIFGAALNASSVELWTDVNGILTADPRIIKNSYSIENVSYQEILEMAHFGAKVVYPPAILPVIWNNIPIVIKNTLNPTFPGTTISKEGLGAPKIKVVTSLKDLSLLEVKGDSETNISELINRSFSALAAKNIKIVMTIQASFENSIYLATKSENAKAAKKAIDDEFKHEIWLQHIDKVQIEKNKSIVALVGKNIKEDADVYKRLFDALDQESVKITATAQGPSKNILSVMVDKKDELKAIKSIHRNFFETESPSKSPINIFMVGPGAVGSELLSQIRKYQNSSANQKIKVLGIMDIDKLLWDEKGIKLNKWNSEFKKGKEKQDFKKFISLIKQSDAKNKIFVDTTASNQIEKYYSSAIKAGCSIVTSNKKPFSGKLKSYKDLKSLATKENKKVLYETTVGAGLPIINTVKSLIEAGDKIKKIEGMLSGTLSYLFSEYEGVKSFGSIVKKAKKMGYTEPDPKDDLTGQDVARKVVILAREFGLDWELKDIEVRSLLSQREIDAKSIPMFLKQLEKSEKTFQKKLTEAKEQKGVLKYTAQIKRNGGKVSLEIVNEQHPFFSTSGTDNIVAIWTKNYKDSPLVIKGPGAGLEVTALGLLSDILKVA